MNVAWHNLQQPDLRLVHRKLLGTTSHILFMLIGCRPIRPKAFFCTKNWYKRSSPKKLFWKTATTTDSRKLQYSCFWRKFCHFRPFVVAITWRQFYRAHHGGKSRIFRWNFDAMCRSSRDINISGIGCHISISGCRRCCIHLPTLLSSSWPIHAHKSWIDLPLEFQCRLS